MEALSNVSKAVGRRMVKVEGDREVGVGEAAVLWAAHLVFTLARVNETGGGSKFGMDIGIPVVHGKKQQAPVENEASST